MKQKCTKCDEIKSLTLLQEKLLESIFPLLKKDGIFILDLGGSEYNLISFFFHEVYLVIEAYIIYYLSKLLNKKIGLIGRPQKRSGKFDLVLKEHLASYPLTD